MTDTKPRPKDFNYRMIDMLQDHLREVATTIVVCKYMVCAAETEITQPGLDFEDMSLIIEGHSRMSAMAADLMMMLQINADVTKESLVDLCMEIYEEMGHKATARYGDEGAYGDVDALNKALFDE